MHLFPKEEIVRRMWIAKVKLTRALASDWSVYCCVQRPILMKLILLKVGCIRSLESQKKKKKLKSSAVPTIQLGAGKTLRKKHHGEPL